MNRQGFNRKCLVLSLAPVFLLFWSAAGNADTWNCSHGHNGHIEFINRVTTMDRVHIGWGLDFEQKSGMINWIHFAPFTTFGQKTRFIALQVQTGSNDVWIDKVHVYDLGSKVHEFSGLGWRGPLKVYTLDLGSEMTFTALGISVETSAGVEMMNHRFWFTGACALVVS